MSTASEPAARLGIGLGVGIGMQACPTSRIIDAAESPPADTASQVLQHVQPTVDGSDGVSVAPVAGGSAPGTPRDDRTREIAEREAKQRSERDAAQRADEDRAAAYAAAQQHEIDSAMAAHQRAVAEGEAYTAERDRLEAERSVAETAAEEEGTPPPPPPPAATEPTPPIYRSDDAEATDDTEGSDNPGHDNDYSYGPAAGGGSGSGDEDGSGVPVTPHETPGEPLPADMSNLPDETWTPSGAPTPPPFQLSDPPQGEQLSDLV